MPQADAAPCAPRGLGRRRYRRRLRSRIILSFALLGLGLTAMFAIAAAYVGAVVEDQAVGTVLKENLDDYAERFYQDQTTEAVRELLRVAFEDHGLRRVVANCFYDNEPSWRLMERLGMRRETHAVRDSLHRSGEWRASLAYALLAEEWRAAADGAPRR